MDYGAILIPSIMGVYFLTQYIKEKNKFRLVMVFISAIGILYRIILGKFSNASVQTKAIIDIIYWTFIIIYLIVHFRKEKSNEEPEKK